MTSRISLLLVVVCALLCLTLLGSCFGGIKPETRDGFTLKVMPLPYQTFYADPQASVLNTSFVTSTSYQVGEKRQLKDLLVKESGGRLTSTPFSMIIDGEQMFPAEYLQRDRCLGQSLWIWPDVYKERNNLITKVYDLKAQTMTDVTPKNLRFIALNQQNIPPRMMYDDKYGITFILRDEGTSRVYVWRGKETAANTDSTEPCIAEGFGYLDGKRCYGLLTRSKKILIFDREEGEFFERPELSGLAKKLALAAGGASMGSKLNRFGIGFLRMVFTKDMAAINSSEAIIVVSNSGKRMVLSRTKVEGGVNTSPGEVVN
jgi:hypothetical protein